MLRALLFAGFGMLAAVAQAADGEPDRLELARQRGALEVAVYRDYPPYSYEKDGKPAGVDVDLAAALARKLDLPLRLRAFSAGESMDDDLRNNVWKGHYLGGGVADVMLHVGADPQYVARQDKVDIFGIYFHEAVSVAWHQGRYAEVSTPLQLAGTRVAVELDSISDFFMSGAFSGRLRSSAVRLPSTAAAVRAFVDGEADAVMAPRGELQGLLQLQGAPRTELRQTEFQGMFRNDWDIGMAVRSGNPALKAALSIALSELQGSGELQAILQRHGIGVP